MLEVLFKEYKILKDFEKEQRLQKMLDFFREAEIRAKLLFPSDKRD